MTTGIRLLVAYDGTDFHGWARQPGTRTVQGVLESAVACMAGHEAVVRGAGRTDRGVHALGQVAAFDSERSIPPHGWLRGLNQTLPDDVSVRQADACEPGYQPRFDAIDKTYRYVVLTDAERCPLLRHRAWRLPPRLWHPSRTAALTAADALDVAAMRGAAARLLGTHDFRAFRAADDEREQTTRTLHGLEISPGWADDPRQIAFTVRGSAFMKNMVRILVGTLIEVGRGRFDADRVSALLGPQGRREDAGPTAPPEGLTLVEVRLGRNAVHAVEDP
ncbi:MAG: tRNA pseudouridine(38-40) synthase TruA [Sandaracinaceae bacterium]|nr:tRNA pseudouridine(38-40) synthase TruA [Sandaracinaceae bacterium]